MRAWREIAAFNPIFVCYSYPCSAALYYVETFEVCRQLFWNSSNGPIESLIQSRSVTLVHLHNG